MRLTLALVLALFLAPLAHAQTTITIQDLPTEFLGQTQLSFTAAAASMQFANDGRTFIWVANAGAVSTTVTVTAVKPSDQGFLQNASYTVPAGKLGIIEALSVRRFNARQTGMAALAFSATTGVTVAAVRMPHARP